MTGGEVARRRLKRIADRAAKAATLPNVRVGFLEKARYPNGTSVAMVAAIQNFGAPRVGIPPRPFFNNMIKANRRTWAPALRRGLKGTDYNVEASLREVGEIMAGQLRQSIKDLNSPALSPVTLMLRKMRKKKPGLIVNLTVVAQARAMVLAGKSYAGVSIKPLIDTKMLFQSVDYEVSNV